MVGRLPQRLVLRCEQPQLVWAMVKLPLAFTHPPVPLPANDHVPVAMPSERVLPTIVPVTEVPFSVSVFPPAVTMKVMVPVTPLVAIFWVRSIDPLTDPPLIGKQEFWLTLVSTLRNSKFEMLKAPLPPTVNWVLKLKPEEFPAPPSN